MSASILEFPTKPEDQRTRAKTEPNDRARYAVLTEKAHAAMRGLDEARRLFPEGTAEYTCIDMARGSLLMLFDMAHVQAYPEGNP